MRKLWDLREFDKINLPSIVGSVANSLSFSWPRGRRLLDCAIMFPDTDVRLPPELSGWQPLQTILSQVFREEDRDDPHWYEDHYVYVTLDQKWVEAGRTPRRAGAHADGFIEANGQQADITTENRAVIAREQGEVSRTYIAYDCCPTEFFAARFPIEAAECETVLSTFDDIADRAEIITYPPYTLLRMDPFVVHRCGQMQDSRFRTFVKVSVSRKRYNREGNTINPLFDYSGWGWVKRSADRNHPTAPYAAEKKDAA